MISYAQNREDVVLWRALREIKAGLYIDVGANDPELHSVTKWFYDQGWRGINFEPQRNFYERICSARPGDINLQKGAGVTSGCSVFYEIEGTGLSTLEPELAQKHEDEGFDVHRTEIETVRLDEVCKEYLELGEDIHFLKVDVEGHELEALQGMDFKQYRPWLVCIEGCDGAVDKLMRKNGYKFALYDGLNRFYVSKEKWNDIGGKLTAGANSGDDYIEHRYVKMGLDFLDNLADESTCKVTAENVYDCYRYILNRVPETETVVWFFMKHASSMVELQQMFFGGEEFRQAHPGLKVICFPDGEGRCLSLAMEENLSQVSEESPSCFDDCLKYLRNGKRYVLMIDTEGCFAGRVVSRNNFRVSGGGTNVLLSDRLKQMKRWVA